MKEPYQQINSTKPQRSLVVPLLLVLILAVTTAALVFVVKDYQLRNQPASEGTTIVNLASQKGIVTAYYKTQYGPELWSLVDTWQANFERHSPNNNSLVVFDLDETVLWNMQLIFDSDYGFISKLWDPWVLSSNATCIEQTCQLYHWLIERDYNVAFITGRHEYQRNATALNLERIGLTSSDILILRQPDEDGMSAVEYKSGHRKKLTKQGWNIVGCIGDQLSDCQGGFAGFIMKVPNYAYFIA